MKALVLTLVSLTGLSVRADWSVSTVLTEPQVTNLSQGPDGALWLTTQGDVYRYVGYESKIVVDAGGIPTFRSGDRILAGSGGALWGVDSAGKLSVIVQGHRQVFPGMNLEGCQVRALVEVSPGFIVIASDRGLFRANRSSPLTGPEPVRGTEGLDVNALSADGLGGLYIGHSRGLAHLPAKGTLTQISGVPDGQAVRAIARRGGDFLWVATGARVANLRDKSPVWLNTPRGTEHFSVDAHGRLLVAGSGGVAVLQGATFQTIASRRNGLFGTVLSLFGDDEGNVWVGTSDRGLLKISRRLVTQISADDLRVGTLNSIVTATDGSVWIAGSNGLVRTQGDSFAPVSLPEGASVTHLVADPAVGVWALMGMGVLRIEGTQQNIMSLGRAEAQTIAPTSNGSVWISWKTVGVSRLVAKATSSGGLTIAETYDDRDGLCPGPYSVVTERARGGVWLGSAHGVSSIDDRGKGSCVSRAQGLPGQAVTSLWEDRDSTLWIGTIMDSGVARLHNGHIATFMSRPDQGLVCDSITGLANDGDNVLWTLCPAMVSRVSVPDLTLAASEPRYIQSIAFDLSDGLVLGGAPDAGNRRIAIDHLHRVWVLSRTGISRIEDLQISMGIPARPPVITGVRASDTAVWPGDDAVYRAQHSDGILDVSLEVVRLGFPARTRFRARLKERTESWWYHGNRFLRFHDVPAGRYELQLAASNGFGSWSATRSYVVEMRPAFVKTRLFWGLVLAALVSVGLILQFVRMKRVAVAAAVAQTERERIARDLHDGLAQGFTTLGLQLEAIEREIGNTNATALKISSETKTMLFGWHSGVRQMIWNLRMNQRETPALDIALAHAIKNAVAVTEGQPDRPKIELQTVGTRRTVAGLVGHEAPLIIQEAVTNALRHSKARVVKVRVDASGDVLLASIEDDGVGMPAHSDAQSLAADGHFGLMGMHERARRAGGQLEIVSDGKTGTRLLLVIPIDDNEAEES